MALQINYDSNYGFAFNTAYVRISETRVFTPVNDSMNRIMVKLSLYANNQARLDDAQPVGILHVEGPFDETSSLSKADLYTWLKTQPGFENATDV